MPSRDPTLLDQMQAVQRAFNVRDFDRAFTGLAPDVEWCAGPWVFDETVLRGRDAVIAFFAGLPDSAGDWKVEAVEVHDGGEGRFVVHQRGHFEGRTTKLSGTLDFFQLFELGADGLVSRVSEYATLDEALEAAR
jgi:hypothetical protein